MTDNVQPSQDLPSAFEMQLRLLQPSPIVNSGQLESELLYRCGWEAALAEAAVPMAGRSSLRGWRAFAAGAASGLMAACLGFACLPLTLGNRPSSQGMASADAIPKPALAVVATHGDEVPEERPAVLFAELTVQQLMTSLVAWGSESYPPLKNLQQESSSMSMDSLSRIARQNWEQLLCETHDHFDPIQVDEETHRMSLGEMLRELGDPQDLL